MILASYKYIFQYKNKFSFFIQFWTVAIRNQDHIPLSYIIYVI